MQYTKIVTENIKRIIFISLYVYLKDQEGPDKKKTKQQCAARFALSSLLLSPSLLLAYRVFPPPAGAAACVCGLRAENHMLFVLFVVTLTTCSKRTDKKRQQMFTSNYRLLSFLFSYGLFTKISTFPAAI